VRLVGNYVHDSVKVSSTEDDNAIVRTWAPKTFDKAKPPGKNLAHHQVLWRLGGYDPVRGVKLVGHRGYCLTGDGVEL
jgi:seryl-tRNA synthetase